MEKHPKPEKETAKTEPQLEHIKQELEHKTKQLEDYTNTLKRLQADFENYIKRTEKEKQEYAAYANGKLLLKVLTLIDDLERALTVQDQKTLTEGLHMVHKEAVKLLNEEGVKPIEAQGKFDPYKHEIIDFQTNEKEEGTIIEELQKGYMLKDKVLRPSRVRVSKGKTEE